MMTKVYWKTCFHKQDKRHEALSYFVVVKKVYRDIGATPSHFTPPHLNLHWEISIFMKTVLLMFCALVKKKVWYLIYVNVFIIWINVYFIQIIWVKRWGIITLHNESSSSHLSVWFLSFFRCQKCRNDFAPFLFFFFVSLNKKWMDELMATALAYTRSSRANQGESTFETEML